MKRVNLLHLHTLHPDAFQEQTTALLPGLDGGGWGGGRGLTEGLLLGRAMQSRNGGEQRMYGQY